MMRSTFWGLGLLGLLTVVACGADPVGPAGRLVGGACSASNQCDSYCTTDKHYPGGMCTVLCASDAQCPAGTACVNEDANFCAVVCASDAQCAAFGRDYFCKSRDRVGASGSTPVCRAP
jgi:hypothetical protein